MVQHCTRITAPQGDLTTATCADIAMIYTGDILLNCVVGGQPSMYFVSVKSWEDGGDCKATKLLDYPAAFNGLSQGYVSNLVYASNSAGKVVTFKIIADATTDTGISLENVAEGTVAGCSLGTDITTGPDGFVYLWCTGNSYTGWRIAVNTVGDTAGYLDFNNVQQVNQGLSVNGVPASSDNTNAGAFCTATYAVGLSVSVADNKVANFWEFGVGFAAGSTNDAPRLTTVTASSSIGTSGGAVKPLCPRELMSDYSFLPPISVSDSFNVPPTTTQLNVLANDIDPYENQLTNIILIDASGSPAASLTLMSGAAQVGTITVVAGQAVFTPGAGVAAGQTVTFRYKAVDNYNGGQQSKNTATVTLTVGNP